MLNKIILHFLIFIARNVNSLNSAEDIITSDGCNASGSNNVNYVEHIQVFIKFSANLHRDVLISIISPANTESQLLSARPYDTGSGQQAWTFSSVHFWGEMSLGNWTIRMSIPINTNQGILFLKNIFTVCSKSNFGNIFYGFVYFICKYDLPQYLFLTSFGTYIQFRYTFKTFASKYKINMFFSL